MTPFGAVMHGSVTSPSERRDTMEQYYTTAEVAARLAVKPQTVRKWIREGTLLATTINGYHRVSESELKRMIEGATECK